MDSETALTTPTTAFVTDWTRLACRLSPAIQSIRRPARLAVITFRFMSDHDDLYLLELQALNEGISQRLPCQPREPAETWTMTRLEPPRTLPTGVLRISNPDEH